MQRQAICVQCNETFQSGTRGSVPEFCSKCRADAYKKRYKGRYYIKKVKSTTSWDSIRLLCLERDCYKRVICGSPTHLDIHHKDNLGITKVGSDANNSLSNLITLCRRCHIGIAHKQTKLHRRKSIIEYHVNHPDLPIAELGRIFHLSRQRVWQILHTN